MRTDEKYTRNLIKMGAPDLNYPYFYRIVPLRKGKWVVELRSWRGRFRSFYYATSSETVPYPHGNALIEKCKEVHDDFFRP